MQARTDPNPDPHVVVRTSDGAIARASEMPDDHGRMLLTFHDGRSLVVPLNVLERQGDGTYFLRASVEELQAEHDEPTVIPVIREELDIRKRVVETDRGVRIHKQVTERQQKVIQLLYREDLDVQRVPVNRMIDAPQPVRYEGATMIVPLCEEVLVIEKRLLLKEEVRVTRREGQVRHAEDVVLRSEHATIERFGDGAGEHDSAAAKADVRRR